jgi:hypothetical protein
MRDGVMPLGLSHAQNGITPSLQYSAGEGEYDNVITIRLHVAECIAGVCGRGILDKHRYA